MHSVATKIMKRVRGRGRGSVWTPVNFLDLGSRAAVDQALSRLVRDGQLQRAARGVYAYPKLSRRLGALTPSPDVVAGALAKSRKSRIQVSGARAANELGLSTQVPAKAVYLTDGPSKRVKIGRQEIQLRHVPSVRMAGAGTKAGMIIEALRYMGRDLDPGAVKRLGSQLSAQDKRSLRDNAYAAPGWARPIVQRIAAM